MKQVNHPNAINYKVAFVVKSELWLIMDLLAGGSCLSLMRAVAPSGIKDLDILAYILRETLEVLKYCHANELLHRDLKAGNILLGSDGRVVLGDFGVAASLKEGNKRTTFVGTPCWMAPEVLEQTCGYDWRADIWSLGITAFELAHGEAPFQRLHPLKVMVLVINEEPARLDNKWDPAFAAVVNSCLRKNPSQRPSALTLLKDNATFFSRAEAGRLKLQNILKSLPPLESRECDGVEKGASIMGLNHQNSGAQQWNWDFEELDGKNLTNKTQPKPVKPDDSDPLAGIAEFEE